MRLSVSQGVKKAWKDKLGREITDVIQMKIL